MKAASSNVETVFSGAGQLPPKLYAEILSNYTVLHHNLKYTWLDPKDDDVVKDYEAYVRHCTVPTTKRADSDSSSDEDVTEDERGRGRGRGRGRCALAPVYSFGSSL